MPVTTFVSLPDRASRLRFLGAAAVIGCSVLAASGCMGKDYNSPPPASGGVTPGAGHPQAPASGQAMLPPSHK